MPGVSGNPKGRPKRRLFDESLKSVLAVKNGRQAKALAARLVEEALKGNIQALRLVAERVGGRVPSPVEAAVNDGETPQQLTREQTRAKLLELLRSPELRALVDASLRPPEVVQ